MANRARGLLRAGKGRYRSRSAPPPQGDGTDDLEAGAAEDLSRFSTAPPPSEEPAEAPVEAAPEVPAAVAAAPPVAAVVVVEAPAAGPVTAEAPAAEVVVAEVVVAEAPAVVAVAAGSVPAETAAVDVPAPEVASRELPAAAAVEPASAVAQSVLPPPSSRRPIAAAGPAQDVSSISGISGAFFREPGEGAPPPAEAHAENDVHAIAFTPETIAHRARLRRMVIGAVALASVLSLAVAGNALRGKPARLAAVAATAMATKPGAAAPKPAGAAPATAAEDPMAVALPPPPPALPDSAEAVGDDKAAGKAEAKVEPVGDKTPSDKPKPTVEPKASDPPSDGEPLKKEALSLLNRGLRKDAIPVARAAIAADPTDAATYLYLGSALQDTGSWKEGVEVYCDCVRNATRGPVQECRQLGGHK
jgi:hypothetical protein